MRLRPLALRSKRSRPLTSVLVLPSLVTMGNLIAGVIALSYLQDAMTAEAPQARDALWAKAAWLIFLGMFFDAMDGRIARLTRSTSAFGAQLDSLADVVTFGVLPAVLAKTLLVAAFPSVSPRLLVALSVVYVVGAALRLARYNVESDRVSPAGESHVTLVFRGLPSPAAAGVVACLVLLRHEYQLHSLDWAVLLGTPFLGLLMISRFPYPHVLNTWLEGSRPLPLLVVFALVVFSVIAFFIETIAGIFLLYAASGVLLWLVARTTGHPRWAVEEDEDEADMDYGAAAESAEDPLRDPGAGGR